MAAIADKAPLKITSREFHHKGNISEKYTCEATTQVLPSLLEKSRKAQ